MGKYIFQLRRGVRYVDDNGNTLLDKNGLPVRDDWTTYTAQEGHRNPLDGELVVEFEYNPNTMKKTPRFKLGYDDKEFADLEYISPDSFILPTRATVTIYPDKWKAVDDDGNFIEESDGVIVNRYIQYVTVNNAVITPNSKVDLQPLPTDVIVFKEKDLTFTAINAGGQVRVCVVGQKPTNTYTFYATVTEVV